MNGLRLVDGFKSALFESRTGLPWSAVATQVGSLEARGLMERSGEHWRASALGQRFLNDVIAAFLPSGPTSPQSRAQAADRKNLEGPGA